MKTLLSSLIIIILSSFSFSQSGDSTFYCSLQSSMEQLYPNNYTPTGLEDDLGIIRGGRYKTSSGVLKMLFVIVRFQGDNQTTTHWTNASVLPSFLSNALDTQVPQFGVYNNNNISFMVNMASGGDNNGTLGELQIIGDVYYVQLDSPRTAYNSDAQVNTAVLTELDDPTGNFNINFRNYDNWEFTVNNQNYVHSYVPYDPQTGTGGDGYVDQAFILWREKSFNGDYGGYSDIKLVGNPFTSNDNNVKLRSSDGSTGFYARNYYPVTEGKYPLGIVVHEYGHYLFGGSQVTGHFDGRSYLGTNGNNEGNITPWGMMVTGGGQTFNAYERFMMDWLEPTIVTDDVTSTTLADSYTNNEAILIPHSWPITGNLEEFYLIENFHSTDHYSSANPFVLWARFDHTFPHGILIYHLRDQDLTYATNSDLDIVCADGIWSWDFVTGDDTPSDRSDDLIFRDEPTRFYPYGYDEKDWISLLSYVDYRALTPSSCGTSCPTNHGRRYHSDDFLGDEEDFWGVERNNVFSTYSNPGTAFHLGDTLDLGIEVLSYNPSTHEYTMTIQYGYSDVLALSPSVPQDLEMTIGGAKYPVLILPPFGRRKEKQLYLVKSKKYRSSKCQKEERATIKSSNYQQ